MTKMKKISKIIPVVLLSGAMVVPVSQLTSPVVAHAYEDYMPTRHSDYTPTTTYLSDIDWKSSYTEYGKIRKNIAHDGVHRLKLRTTARSNDTQKYDKGIGIHANGEIVINLEDKEYHEFNADVGVLQVDGVSYKDNSSIRYQFYVDGKLVKDTGTMRYDTPKQHIYLNLIGAKELKIVVNDAGDANYGDWGVIGDAKFTTYVTEYSRRYDERVSYEYSDWKQATNSTMYVYGNYPYESFVSNRRVTFNSESTDPLMSTRPTTSISSENGYKYYLGRTYGYVTLGCRVQYKVEHATRTKYYMNDKGRCFKQVHIPFVSKTPSSNCEYRIVNVSDIQK